VLSGTVNPIYSIILALLVYKCRQGVAPPYLADELCQPADTEARCCLRSASTSSLIVRRIRGCQPSVTELFRSPPLVPGTVFRSMSRQHRHWPSFAVASRLLSSGADCPPYTRLSTVGDRAFLVAAPRTWNNLPQHVTSAPSLAIFRSRLKTPLFRRCFP